MNVLAPYRKAVAAFFVGGLAALAPALNNGVTAAEWLTIIVAAFASSGIVYQTPNAE